MCTLRADPPADFDVLTSLLLTLWLAHRGRVVLGRRTLGARSDTVVVGISDAPYTENRVDGSYLEDSKATAGTSHISPPWCLAWLQT